MKVLFLLHEQCVDYKDEPGYTEVVKPFLASGYVSESRDYVFQRELRKNRDRLINQRIREIQEITAGEKVVVYGAGDLTRKLYPLLDDCFDITAISDGNKRLWDSSFCGTSVVPPAKISDYAKHVIISAHASQDEIESHLVKLYGDSLNIHKIFETGISTDKIHNQLEDNIIAAVEAFKPHIIVHTLTFMGENLRGSFLKRLTETFPATRIYTQWWDYDENIPALLAFEKDCLKYSDMVGIIDSHSRYSRIRDRSDIYKDYPCVEKLHWHPTIFDPNTYRKIETPKKYDIAIMGSAEGIRKDYIAFLSETYGDRFHHFGGRSSGDSFISRGEYVQILNQTRIFVNTQTNPNRIQLKGKVREAFACGSFILEEDNPETRIYAEDTCGLDYFSDPDQLREKIDYYLAHPYEREQIAIKGHAWYEEKFNARQWTGYILKVLGFETPL